MAKNVRKPRKIDAVLGGQVSSPVNDAVLGGIERLYQRFASVDEKVRFDAVVNASKYSDEGIDILVKALKDTSLTVRMRAYQILKELNKAESEIAKGIRLNVGDKVYCVYCSSLSYGDDWYYLQDSMNKDYESYTDEEQLFYKPQSDDGHGYAHYITSLRKENVCRYDNSLPQWMSVHISRDKAKQAANNLHLQRLLELDDEYGMIYNQTFIDANVLKEWCKQNGLPMCSDSDANEFQILIFKYLQQSVDLIDIKLLDEFWKMTAYGQLAFVYKRTINRKCYFRVTDNI